MKKIMSLVLALALVLSMGVTVFAEETIVDNTTGNGSKDIDVTAKYEAGDKAWGGEKYYVTISWSETNNLKYKDNTVTYNWNTTDMKYEESKGADGAFTGTDVITVNVENKSNMAITATCAVKEAADYTMTTDYDDTNGSSFDVDTNAPKNYTDVSVVKAVTQGTSVTISEVSGTAITADTKVATLTVTIAKSANATTPTAD